MAATVASVRDRRQGGRYRGSFRAQLFAGSWRSNAQVVDLGLGGMRARLRGSGWESYLRKGQGVRVHLRLPGGRTESFSAALIDFQSKHLLWGALSRWDVRLEFHQDGPQVRRRLYNILLAVHGDDLLFHRQDHMLPEAKHVFPG